MQGKRFTPRNRWRSHLQGRGFLFAFHRLAVGAEIVSAVFCRMFACSGQPNPCAQTVPRFARFRNRSAAEHPMDSCDSGTWQTGRPIRTADPDGRFGLPIRAASVPADHARIRDDVLDVRRFLTECSNAGARSIRRLDESAASGMSAGPPSLESACDQRHAEPLILLQRPAVSPASARGSEITGPGLLECWVS